MDIDRKLSIQKSRRDTINYIGSLRTKIAALELELAKKGEDPKRPSMTGLELRNALDDAIQFHAGGNEVVLDLGGMLGKIRGVIWGPEYIELKLGTVTSRRIK